MEEGGGHSSSDLRDKECVCEAGGGRGGGGGVDRLSK